MDQLDLGKKGTVDLVQKLWKEYLEGEDPVFEAGGLVHIGMDEYFADGEDYRSFANDMISMIQESGRTVRMWGSLSRLPGRTQVASENVQMQTETIENYYKIEDFKWLNQNPELPTGCEITSLTSVLNYYGINVKKETMADDYLKKGNGSYYKMFLGNPRDAGSFGCMAQPIVDAANLYFKKNNVSMKASNVSGVSFEKILEYVSQGVPMIVWNTMGMAPAYESKTLTLDGREYTWIAPEHCVVVVGYDLDNNEVYVADPMTGMVTRNLKIFEERYVSLKRQAVYVTR